MMEAVAKAKQGHPEYWITLAQVSEFEGMIRAPGRLWHPGKRLAVTIPSNLRSSLPMRR